MVARSSRCGLHRQRGIRWCCPFRTVVGEVGVEVQRPHQLGDRGRGKRRGVIGERQEVISRRQGRVIRPRETGIHVIHWIFSGVNEKWFGSYCRGTGGFLQRKQGLFWGQLAPVTGCWPGIPPPAHDPTPTPRCTSGPVNSRRSASNYSVGSLKVVGPPTGGSPR